MPSGCERTPADAALLTRSYRGGDSTDRITEMRSMPAIEMITSTVITTFVSRGQQIAEHEGILAGSSESVTKRPRPRARARVIRRPTVREVEPEAARFGCERSSSALAEKGRDRPA